MRDSLQAKRLLAYIAPEDLRACLADLIVRDSLHWWRDGEAYLGWHGYERRLSMPQWEWWLFGSTQRQLMAQSIVRQIEEEIPEETPEETPE